MADLVLTRPALPSTALEAAEQAAERARRARAANTLRAYRSDWRDFEAACARLGLPLETTPQVVAVYIDQLARAGAKVSTIRRRIAAINAHRRADGLPSLSVREEPLASVLRGIRRDIGAPPRRARPLEIEELRQVVAACPDTPKGRRDRALLLVGFAGGFRRSELSGLDWGPDGDGTAYVEFVPEGLRIRLKRSKTNQTGELEEVAICRGAYAATCPVRALEEWRVTSMMEAPAGAEGSRDSCDTNTFAVLTPPGYPCDTDTLEPNEAAPVFRPVDRHGNIAADRLRGHGVRRAIREATARAAKAAGASAGELEAALIGLSGHSLRAGLVTTAFAAGLTSEDVMRQTRHRDLKTLLGYRRHATAFIGNISGKVGL